MLHCRRNDSRRAFHERQDRAYLGRRLRIRRAEVRQARAGGLLGRMVRAMQDDRPDSRRNRRRVRRQDQDLQARHRRQPGNPAEIRHPRDPHPHAVQERRGGGHQGRRALQVPARGVSRQQYLSDTLPVGAASRPRCHWKTSGSRPGGRSYGAMERSKNAHTRRFPAA